MSRLYLNTSSLVFLFTIIVSILNYLQCDNHTTTTTTTAAPVEEELQDYSTEPTFALQWPNKSTTNCSNNEYRCTYSGECIPKEWSCDRLLDCADGSDEFPNFQKPTNLQWSGPDVCELCSSSYFRCKSSAECIPRGWICDGKHDCGYVINGQDTSDEDNDTCKDLRQIQTIDEIALQNFTKIRHDYVPSIAILDSNEIRFVQSLFSPNQTVIKFKTTIPTKKLYSIVSSVEQDKFCAFYKQNSSIVCWRQNNNSTESVPIIHSLPNDINGENIVSIVPDLNTGNWYFLEQEKDRVILCSPNLIDCVVVLDHKQLSRVQAFDVDPTEGLLFVAQAGDQARSDTTERGSCILKCSLDGSETATLVDTALVNPTYVTIDTQKRRLFWIDSYLQIIEYIDYDGKNRIKLESKTLSSISPWWSGMHLQVNSDQALILLKNYVRNNVSEYQMAYLDLGENILVLKNIFVQNSDVRVNAVRTKSVTGLTKVIRLICAKCEASQICVPKFDYLTRQMISTTCLQSRPLKSLNSTKNSSEPLLVYSRSSPGLIKVRPLMEDVTGDVRLSFAKCSTWFDIDYSQMNIYYIDDCRNLLIVQSLLSPEYSVPIIHDLGSINMKQIEAIALNHYTKSLYIVESKIGAIEILKIYNKTLYHKRLITGLGNAKTLALDSQNGLMFFTQYGLNPDDKDAWKENPDSGPWIKKAYLDGSNNKILVNGPFIRYPNCLALDSHNKQLYWGDFNRIERINYNGNHRKLMLESIRIGIITSIDIFRDEIFWSELQHGTIQKHNINSNMTEVLLQEHAPIYQLRIVQASNMYKETLFRSNCSQITLSTPAGQRCVCGENFQTDEYDDTRCVSIQEHPKASNDTRPIKCSPKEFSCDQNGKCIPYHWVCDGHRDCMDISDEASERACRGTTCPPGYFRCHSRNLCLEPSWRCDGEPDCGPDDNSDEADC